MLSLEMLDVVIGVIFIYLLLSLICTAVNEFMESRLKLRAVDLEQGIRELLSDPDGEGYTKKIYDHPLIYSLFRGKYDPSKIRNMGKITSTDKKNLSVKNKRYSRGSDLPSYIPSKNFALALMDVLLPSTNNAPGGTSGTVAPQNTSLSQPDAAGKNQAPVKPNPLKPLRDAVDSIENNDHIKNALLPIIDAAGDDATKAREGIENWYNSIMDRVSGWYKRRVQQIVFIMGFSIAIVMNVDTFAVFGNLINDRPLRSSIVSTAENIRSHDTTGTVKLKDKVDELLQLGLPIGWSWKSDLNPQAKTANLIAIPQFNTGKNDIGHSLWIWFLKIFGWIITGFAVSLGAPFWFDMLNKIMVVRSTIKPHEKSQEESSKDNKR